MPQTGTDKQGRKVRWDDEKGVWVPAETGKDNTGNPVWFDGEKWNPIESQAKVAEAPAAPQKTYDKPYMIGRAGMTPEYAASLAKNAGMGQQFVGGALNSMTLGGLKKIAPDAIPEPQTDAEKAFRGAGDLTGFLGTPVKLAGGAIKLGGKIISKVAPGVAKAAKTSAPLVRAAGRVAKGGAELGAATALSDILDPEAQGLAEKFKAGGTTGSLFAAIALVNPASKILGQAIKQVGGRVLGQALGSYDIKDPDLTNRVFNEILYTYFISKGYNSKQIEANRRLAQAEIDRINAKAGTNIIIDPRRMLPQAPTFIGTERGVSVPYPATEADINKALLQSSPVVPGPFVDAKGKPIREVSVTKTKPELPNFSPREPAIGGQFYPPNPFIERGLTTPPGTPPPPTTPAAGKIKTTAPVPPSEASKPLDITSSQMKQGLDAFDAQWLKDESGIGIVDKGDSFLKKINKYLVESGTITATPDKTVAYQLSEVSKATKDAAPAVDKLKEKRFLYGVTAEKNLARFGPAGESIASAANEYARTKRSQTLKDNTSVMAANVAARGVYQKTTETGKEYDASVHKRVAAIIEKRAEPKDAQEANLAKMFDAPFQKVRDRVKALQAKGVKVKVDGPYGSRDFNPEFDAYYPRVYENLSEVLSSDLPKGKHARQILAERMAKREFADLYKDPATRESAIEKATRVIDIRRSQMSKGKYGHLEKARLWETEDLADLEAKGIIKRLYGTSVLSDYFAKTNDRLAWLEQFGHDVHQYVPGGVQTIPKLLADKLPEIKDVDNRLYAANFFRDYMNRGQMTSRTRLAYDLIGKFQNLKLWMAGIPNSTQWFINTLPKTPIQDVPKVFLETVKSSAKGKYGLEFLNEAGIQMLASDINKMNFDRPEVLRAFNDMFFKITGFKATESWNARFSAFAGRATAERFAKRLSSRPDSFRAEFWESELKRMGVEQSTIETLKKGGSSTLSLQELAKSGWAMKKWTQFVSEEFFLPATFSKEWASPAIKFKNYPYNQTVTWMGGEILKPAVDLAESFTKKGHRGRQGDIAPLMKAIITIPLGGWAVAQMKKKIYGLLGINLYRDIIDNGPVWEKLGLYILNAGNLGIVTDIMLASGGHELLTSIFGPTASDFVAVSDGFIKSSKELFTAFEAKNPQFLKDRKKAIESYWLRVGSKLLPPAKPIINVMFSDYKKINNAKRWVAKASEYRKKYMVSYIYNSPEVAEQVWDAYVSTFGEQYYKMFGELPKKPTTNEIVNYSEGLQEMPGEGMIKK